MASSTGRYTAMVFNFGEILRSPSLLFDLGVQDLQYPYIRDHVRGILQKDFVLLESYVPSTLQKLPLPLCALCAKGAGLGGSQSFWRILVLNEVLSTVSWFASVLLSFCASRFLQAAPSNDERLKN